MLTGEDLRYYRTLRGLTLRDVARYCKVVEPDISAIENGRKPVTKYTETEIIKGINSATQARIDGTFDALKEEESKKMAEEYRQKQEKKKAPTRKRTATKKTTGAE